MPTSTSRGYLGLWARVPRELGFLLLALPVAAIGYGITTGLLSAGIGSLAAFLIGVVFLIGALYVARWIGTFELIRLDWSGHPPISRPRWVQADPKPGFFAWLGRLFGSGHYWLYLLHSAFVNFVISTVTWSIVVTWLATALGGIGYWFWSIFIERDGFQWHISNRMFGGTHGEDILGISPFVADGVIFFVIGLLALATLPFVTRGLTIVHHATARLMLGAWRSEALAEQVTELSGSREAAVSAEGHSLRRLERDIHDGPQQSLVRLQMDLALAERKLAEEPEEARALLAQAQLLSREALDELRSLSRGFAPPLLQDRGLVAALESMVNRTPVPVVLENALPAGLLIPADIERNAYFVASELVANSIKHARASSITLALIGDDQLLTIVVSDDGVGGALALPEHGLAGLEGRVRGLGGSLEIASPDGGPTVVTAALPLPVGALAS